MKLFCYQTFLKLGEITIHDMNIKKSEIKKLGHRACLFTRQQALKMGYFYWLHVKSSNHLHTELNIGYLKGIKFCLESKASFIGISTIASLKPVLIDWLREYCTFPGSFVVNLKSSPWPKHTQLGAWR